MLVMSFSKLLEHFEFSNQYMNYGLCGISSMMYSVIITAALTISTLVPIAVDGEESIRRLNLGNWANIIKENDLDDILIHRKRMQIDGLRGKADNLTEESILFSALSFTAFLSMAMADRVRFNDLLIDDTGLRNFGNIIYIIVTGKIRESETNILEYLRGSSILFIALLLLLCSIFFMCNIVALARFNDRHHKADSFVKAAEWLNAKEESISEAEGSYKKESYKAAILGILDSANYPIMATKIPLVQMKIFRMAGITCFLLCGLVCANLFSSFIFTAVLLIILLGIAIEIADSLFHSISKLWGRGDNRLIKLFDSHDA